MISAVDLWRGIDPTSIVWHKVGCISSQKPLKNHLWLSILPWVRCFITKWIGKGMCMYIWSFQFFSISLPSKKSSQSNPLIFRSLLCLSDNPFSHSGNVIDLEKQCATLFAPYILFLLFIMSELMNSSSTFKHIN